MVAGGMLAKDSRTLEKIQSAIKDLGNKYSPDKLIASLSFGFWVTMFNKSGFNAGGKTLLKIFLRKEKGLGQKEVYKELRQILNFRNRIAHHEPICFNMAKRKDTFYVRNNYRLIYRYIRFLGYNTNEIFGALMLRML